MLYNLIRKLFLVKEIISQFGHVHFRRYRLLQTPWFAIYIHQILRSDEDNDMHDHPWKFTSVILSGSYEESVMYPPNFYAVHHYTYHQGDVVEHAAEDAHRLRLKTKEVWTLVIASGRKREWGYRLRGGVWIPNREYRISKNNKQLG